MKNKKQNLLRVQLDPDKKKLINLLRRYMKENNKTFGEAVHDILDNQDLRTKSDKDFLAKLQSFVKTES